MDDSTYNEFKQTIEDLWTEQDTVRGIVYPCAWRNKNFWKAASERGICEDFTMGMFKTRIIASKAGREPSDPLDDISIIRCQTVEGVEQICDWCATALAEHGEPTIKMLIPDGKHLHGQLVEEMEDYIDSVDE